MEITVGFSEKAAADLALVEEAKRGCEKAFTSLMNRYRDSIYYMLLKMVNNTYDAEDLTIETFGKAFRNLDSYVPRYAFSTWLFKIATNNCVDFTRKKQMSPLVYDGAHDEDGNIAVAIKSELPDPEESLINNQKKETLKNCINRMKPKYRKLIQLRYYEEYSYDEIATELEMPIGTIKAELNRAKTLLYDMLAKTDNR